MIAGATAAVAGDDDDDEPEEHYGAIAYSPSTRAHGWSYDYPSRGGAERRALDQCRRHAGDCIIAVRFRRACGALAVGPDGYGSGWGATRKLAQGYALRSCARYSDGCTVVRWVCTTR
jgi:serine/threonine-protein kinase